MRLAVQSMDIAGERMSGVLVLSGRNIFIKYVKWNRYNTKRKQNYKAFVSVIDID